MAECGFDSRDTVPLSIILCYPSFVSVRSSIWLRFDFVFSFSDFVFGFLDLIDFQ